jgi:hypothetical protein
MTDGHGSTRALINATGAATSSLDYDAFGGAIGFDLASAGSEFLYGGDAIYDPTSGLYLHGNGVRGRDEFRFIEADDPRYGRSGVPRTLHPYIYSSGDPRNIIDPSGHWNATDVTATMGIITTLMGEGIIGLGYLAVHRTPETVFRPNWGNNYGPVEHGTAWVTLAFPSGSAQQLAQQMYADLQGFNYFSPPNIATAYPNGNIVSFSTSDGLGYLQDRINPTDPSVRIINGPNPYELSGVTLGSHMLSGVRRWRVIIVNQSPPVLRIETEAYEQTAGDWWLDRRLNQLGRSSGLGQNAQYAVWDNYLNNIASHWVATAGATTNWAMHMPEQSVGYFNPWRSQLPSDLQHP